jgi:ADP-ribose pyrophosphatase
MIAGEYQTDKPTGRAIGWERLETSYPYANRFFRVRQDRVRLPNGNEREYAYTEMKGAVFVVPLTDDGHIVLIRQYRYPSDDWCWEVPAGSLSDHAGTLEELAHRELLEEAGATCDGVAYINWYYGTTSGSNLVCHVLLAQGVRLDREPEPEETEFVEIHSVPVDTALSWARNGQMRGGLSALALLLCEPLLRGQAR